MKVLVWVSGGTRWESIGKSLGRPLASVTNVTPLVIVPLLENVFSIPSNLRVKTLIRFPYERERHLTSRLSWGAVLEYLFHAAMVVGGLMCWFRSTICLDVWRDLRLLGYFPICGKHLALFVCFC